MPIYTPEKYLLDIGYGLKIGLKAQSVWQVWAKNGCADLNQTSDFLSRSSVAGEAISGGKSASRRLCR
jgi:hypothetical protein